MGRNGSPWLFIIVTVFIVTVQTGSLNLAVIMPTVAFPNSGFEINPTSSSNGWIWPASDWVWDGSVAHTGSHSARVYRGSGNETNSVWSDYITVQPSTIYQLSYWLRTQNATWWPSVSLYQYKTGNIQTGPRLIAHANISAGMSAWKNIQYSFQTMPDASSIRVRIALWTQASGTFWFDDFGLEEGPHAIYPFHPGFPVLANGSVFVSSPVVADINGDGDNELLIAGGSAVNGWDRNGAILPGYPLNTNDKHIQSQIAVADLDGDGDLEIAAGTKTPIYDGRGRVFIWHHTGTLVNGWPKSVDWDTTYAHNESLVSTIVMADIDGDQDMEILAGTSNNTAAYSGSTPPAAPNLYAWRADGSRVAGQWPTWHNTAGFYGCIAAGDLNGDGIADVEVGRDHHYLNVYGSSGTALSGWPIETYLNANAGRYEVDEHIGYNLAAPVIADLDGNGVMEFIVAGFVGGPGATPIHNSAVLVLEPDGSRRPGWETPALGAGILNLEDMSIQAPAVADLDGDGSLEIIVTTNDGWIRAYQSDKELLWSFNYTQGAVLVATEPVVGDIDGDGLLEVVFGTRVPARSGGVFYNGPVGLWALKSDGKVAPGFPLPVPTPGMFGAPTLADLDSDGELEILVAAREGHIYSWDTSTPYNPMQLPWPTGRHDLNRSASYTPLTPLEASHKLASPRFVTQGQTASFTINIISTSPVNETISFTDTIPAGVSFVPGSLSSTSGVATYSAGVIRWSGDLSDVLEIEITYDVVVTTSAARVIRNTAIIDTITNGLISRSVDLYANLNHIFLPLIRR